MSKTQESLKQIYSELVDSERIELFIIPEIRFDNKKSDYLYLHYKDYFNDTKLVFNKPGSHLKYLWLQYKQQNTLIHHHWLDCQDGWDLISISFKLLCLMIYKKLDGKIVWTIHNKKPLQNRYKRFNKFIRSWLADNADRLLVHCESVIPEVGSYFGQPKDKFRIIKHPKFPAEFISRKKSLKKLNKEYDLDLKESDQVFLMFGNINSKKRIKEVCKIFSGLSADKRLLIAGPVKKGHLNYYRKIIDDACKSMNINILPNFISEYNVPLFFNSADCVVFNYSEIIASGGVELAKSYNRPVIAPNSGCIAEIRDENITLFNTQNELEELIQNFTQKQPVHQRKTT